MKHLRKLVTWLTSRVVNPKLFTVKTKRRHSLAYWNEINLGNYSKKSMESFIKDEEQGPVRPM